MEKHPRNGQTGKEAQQSWGKQPLLLLGRLPVEVQGLAPTVLTEHSTHEHQLNNFYFVLALTPDETNAMFGTLAQLGVPPDQILVFWPAEVEQEPAHPYFAHLGLVHELPGENETELRARLLQRVELQRQKKLGFLLEEARAHPSHIDSARLAHALASALQLGPRAHHEAILACLEGAEPPAGAWPSLMAQERLVAEAAALMARALEAGESVRETLREKTAQLPFRVRNELLQKAEACFGSLGKAGKNAA